MFRCEVAGFKYWLNLELGQAAIDGATIPIDGPSRTYLIDGQGHAKRARFSLLYDNHSGLFLEDPAQPARTGRQVNNLPGRPKPSADQPAGARRVAKLNFRACGAWNGKLVHGFFEREDVDKPTDSFDRSYPPYKFRSDVGLVFVFTRIPYSFDGSEAFLGPGDEDGEEEGLGGGIARTSTITQGRLVARQSIPSTRPGRST